MNKFISTETRSDSQESESCQNPLLVPEVCTFEICRYYYKILEQLFQYFDVSHYISTLCQLRYVCSMWNLEISRKIRLQHQFLINGLDELGIYYNFLNNDFSSSSSVDHIPFYNYKLIGRNWYTCHLLNETSIFSKLFISNYNTIIHRLHLEINGWNLWDCKLFFYTVHLPNLKELSWRCPSELELYSNGLTLIPPSSQIQLTTIKLLKIYGLKTILIPLIIELLQANPTLNNLIIKEQSIIKCISTNLLQSITKLYNLQHLTLDFYLTNTQLHLLLSSGIGVGGHGSIFYMKLRSLSIALQSNLNTQLLNNLLRKLSARLVNLEFFFEPMSNKIDLNNCFKFVCLRKLTRLKLTNTKACFDLFLKICPNLQDLSLINFEGISMLALPFSQLKHLTSLSIDTTIKTKNSDINFGNYIEDICYICPNLKYLSLHGKLSNCTVQLILNSFKGLISLKLCSENVHFDDDAFSGFICNQNMIGQYENEFGSSFSQQGTCKERKNSYFEQIFELEEVEMEEIPRKCICQLKDLRDLHIELNPIITDAIVFNTIGHCTQLKRLTLKGSKLTDSALKLLVNNLRLNQITFHGGYINPKSKVVAENAIKLSSSEPYCEIKEIEVENQLQLFESIISAMDHRSSHFIPLTTCSIV